MSARASLEGALVELASTIEWPPEPDVSARVVAAIESRVAAPVSARPPLRRGWAFAAALVLLVAALFTFSPTTREAVADFIGLGGIRISSGDRPNDLPELGENVALGAPVDGIAGAEEIVDFEIATPTVEGFAEPDAVHADDDFPPGGRASLVYAPRPDLPETSETGVGLLLTQFEGTPEVNAIKKLHSVGVHIRFTDVDGAAAYWIAGGSHTISYIDANGDHIEETTRLAGNTLIWQANGVTFRLESALGFEEALAIATSIR